MWGNHFVFDGLSHFFLILVFLLRFLLLATTAPRRVPSPRFDQTLHAQLVENSKVFLFPVDLHVLIFPPSLPLCLALTVQSEVGYVLGQSGDHVSLFYFRVVASVDAVFQFPLEDLLLEVKLVNILQGCDAVGAHQFVLRVGSVQNFVELESESSWFPG